MPPLPRPTGTHTLYRCPGGSLWLDRDYAESAWEENGEPVPADIAVELPVEVSVWLLSLRTSVGAEAYASPPIDENIVAKLKAE
jgi:hypothetical protein